MTYAISGMYAVAMHDLLKRMQILMIARYAMKDKDQGQPRVARAAQRSFLRVSNIPQMVVPPLRYEEGVSHGYLVESGITVLVKEVRSAVEEIAGPLKIGILIR